MSAAAASTARRRAGRVARRGSRNIGVDGSTHSKTSMSDAGFLVAADAALAAIGAALDRALEASDADVDWNLVDGILEIACEDGSKVIVNRHGPNRELWVAARRGGFHFRRDGDRWVDTRTGEELGMSLARVLKEQAGIDVALDLRAKA